MTTTTLAAGATATITLPAGDRLSITGPGNYQVTAPGRPDVAGTQRDIGPMGAVVGMFDVPATVRVTAGGAAVRYEALGAGDVLDRNGRAVFSAGQAAAMASSLAGLASLNRIFDKFDRLSDWTYATSNGGIATITQADGRGPFSSAGLRFQTSGTSGANATVTKNVTFNMNSHDGFWLLSDVRHRQSSAATGIALYASPVASIGGGNRWTFANPIPSLAVSLQPIWVPKSGWTVLDGAPDWADDMLSFRARIDSGTSATRDVTLCGSFMKSTARPAVILSIDDGSETSYTVGHVEAVKRSIPLTHYVIPQVFGTATYITRAQAEAMKAAGDYLGLHGAAEWDADLSRIAADVAACRAAGVDTAHAAYPAGAIGSGTTWGATQAALAAHGVKTARLAGVQTPTLRAVGDMLALSSYPLNNTMSLNAAKAAVDTAVASGGTCIFYAHKFGGSADGTTWVTADWIALLDYVRQLRMLGTLDVLRIDEWYATVV